MVLKIMLTIKGFSAEITGFQRFLNPLYYLDIMLLFKTCGNIPLEKAALV